MSLSVVAKFVAIVSLCSPFLLATPAAAQRVVQRSDAYPQQRSSGNYGGGFLEFLFTITGTSHYLPDTAHHICRAETWATTMRLIASLPTDRRLRSTHPFSAA